jgi:uncharacterized protein YcbK (DUF882 family)
MQLTRRRFALQTVIAAGAVAFVGRVRAADSITAEASRLSLYNTHTGELLAADLCGADGQYDAQCLSQLDHLLRDHRNDAVHEIDRGLFAQLLALPIVLGVPARYEVISGYRSVATNEALRAAGHGVAVNSMHLEGRAIDVRLLGVDCARLRDVALAAARGGVGYYASSDFVHLDTGRVRTWAG